MISGNSGASWRAPCSRERYPEISGDSGARIELFAVRSAILGSLEIVEQEMELLAVRSACLRSLGTVEREMELL